MKPQAARDNTYGGTFGDSGWGAKAQQILGQVLIIPPALPFSPTDLPGEDACLAFWLEVGNSPLSPFSVIAIRRPGVYTCIFVR